MAQADSEFADDIVPDRAPAHLSRPSVKFRAWHRVRKEYVRRYQWNELSKRMIVRWLKPHLDTVIEAPEGQGVHKSQAETQVTQRSQSTALVRPLNCLVIPGDDLLDVRALWRDCKELKCVIRYLGFNRSGGSDVLDTRLHIAHNAVTSLSGVATDSVVVGDSFESIAGRQSQAHQYLKQYGPYHIVNLDFCGSVVPNKANDAQRYHDAIHQLLVYQFANQRSHWLLFITTEVEPAMVDVNTFQILCRPTRRNVDMYNDYAERIAKMLPIAAFRSEEQTVNISELSDEDIVQVCGIALGKWMLSLCQQAQPKWTISMRRSFRYLINAKGVVMLSLAFELHPNISPPIDAFGLSRLSVDPPQHPDEHECALKLAESVAAICDVDKHLAANPELKVDLRDAQADLLHLAGYDRDAYVDWVDNGERLD